MISAQFERVTSLLCLGAHPDDIEIGCGGTILKLLGLYPSVNVHWVVLSGAPERRNEAQHCARHFLAGARSATVVVKDFRDRFFPYCGGQIKEYFFELAMNVQPDLILTHRLEDRHQDHRLVSELTWNTFRDHVILEYEIPKYEGDLGHPNLFVDLDQDTCARKIEAIVTAFRSQRKRAWFSSETFWSLLRLRGLEADPSAEFAEGLFARKLLV
ncbi:MAG: PIG-L deacetylase family protein [Planctomycetota bacterium]